MLDAVPKRLEALALKSGLWGADRDPLVCILDVKLARQLAQNVSDALCLLRKVSGSVTVLSLSAVRSVPCALPLASTNPSSSTNDPSAQAQVQGLMAARSDTAILAAPPGLLADDAASERSDMRA